MVFNFILAVLFSGLRTRRPNPMVLNFGWGPGVPELLLSLDDQALLTGHGLRRLRAQELMGGNLKSPLLVEQLEEQTPTTSSLTYPKP